MRRVGAILVLEHDRAIGDMIGEILSDDGYSISAFLDLASSRVLLPALSLLDSTMPAKTLATVLEYARSHSFTIPVVSMATSPSIAVAYLERGCLESLIKRFEFDNLLACVARYVCLLRKEIQLLRTTDTSETIWHLADAQPHRHIFDDTSYAVVYSAGGLEGRSPSKISSFWLLSATFVADSSQKEGFRGRLHRPRTPTA